jgi:Molybdopterin-binding domain of aldehyde dehydrogenase
MKLAILDLAEGNAMRAPGLMALEIAMDEMAERLGLDPVEFRVLNDTQVDVRAIAAYCWPNRLVTKVFRSRTDLIMVTLPRSTSNRPSPGISSRWFDYCIFDRFSLVIIVYRRRF